MSYKPHTARKLLTVREWRASIEEGYIVLPRGNVLVKTVYARLCSIDAAIPCNPLLYREGGVLGCSGVGFVVEAGVDADASLSGRRVALKCYTPSYAPPLVGEGFAATYTSVPPEALELIHSLEPHYTYLVDTCIALEAVETANLLFTGGRVGVYGGGVAGVLAAYVFTAKGYDVDLIVLTRESKEFARTILDVRVFEKPSGAYDLVFVAAIPGPDTRGILSSNSILILHPHAHLASGSLQLPPNIRRAVASVAWGCSARTGFCMDVLEGIGEELTRKAVQVRGFTSPPPKPPLAGVILNLQP